MNPIALTPSQLKRAAAIKEQIEKLNKELRGILGVSTHNLLTSEGEKPDGTEEPLLEI